MLADILFSQNKPQEMTLLSNARLRDALLSAWKSPVEEERAISVDAPFRASSVSSMCPRAYALSMITPMSTGDDCDAEGLWIFGIGNAYQDLMQNDALLSLGKVFQGWWKRFVPFRLDSFAPGQEFFKKEIVKGDECSADQFIEHAWCPRPEGDGWRYEEMYGFIPHLNIGGHFDGILSWEDGCELFELKTINEFMFNGVDPAEGGRPLSSHIIQVHVYMMMTGLRRARIVYIGKAKPSMKVAMVEHLVDYDENVAAGIRGLIMRTRDGMRMVHQAYQALIAFRETVIGTVDPASERGKDIEQLKEMVLKALPERLCECSKLSDKRTKNCFARKPCFSKKSILD